MGRGEKSLLRDPGSELRLGGREKKKGEDTEWNGKTHTHVFSVTKLRNCEIRKCTLWIGQNEDVSLEPDVSFLTRGPILYRDRYYTWWQSDFWFTPNEFKLKQQRIGE